MLVAADQTQRFRFQYEIGNRRRLHFLHRLPAVQFDRDLAQAQFGRDLLVQQPVATIVMMVRSRGVSVS